nr:uncharacterized protein LOC103345344 isoform X2 [Oryctolagus cuniculus]
MAAGAVLATGAGPGVVGAGSLWAGGVQALRCAARCLSLRLLENNGSLVWCQNDKQCSTCLEPCKHPGELETGPCQSLCELLFPVWSHECLSSCALWSARRWRPSRGHVRHRPEPAALLRLAWSAVRPMPSAPGAGSAAPMAVGAPARLPGGPSETTDQRVWLPDVRPGGWYQFRVAAVNVHGTQGFTTPVRHFRSSRAPLAPLALADLRVNSTVRDADGTVAATVIWEPPEDPDVPVHHYRVSWGHATEGQWQRKLVDGHWSSVTLQHLRPGSVYTVQLQPLGADVAARPQGCPALHSCQRHIVPIGPQLQCKALTESASLGLPRSLCSECSCQSWVISILNGLPRSLCGKGTCQSWVTMETPHGLPRSLCSWGFCQSYVTMETPRGLPRSLCSKRSYQSCVICVPNRLPRSLCGRGSCQSVHSSNSYTQDCHTHEHACANLATYVCTHMAATRRSGVTTFDGEAAERPQGHNL